MGRLHEGRIEALLGGRFESARDSPCKIPLTEYIDGYLRESPSVPFAPATAEETGIYPLRLLCKVPLDPRPAMEADSFSEAATMSSPILAHKA